MKIKLEHIPHVHNIATGFTSTAQGLLHCTSVYKLLPLTFIEFEYAQSKEDMALLGVVSRHEQ